MKHNPMHAHRIARLSLAVIVLTIVILAFVAHANQADASNKTWFDMVYTFHRAQVSMPDGSVIEGQVEAWTDWQDSDAVQVRIGGVTYYTHLSNVVLIAD